MYSAYGTATQTAANGRGDRSFIWNDRPGGNLGLLTRSLPEQENGKFTAQNTRTWNFKSSNIQKAVEKLGSFVIHDKEFELAGSTTDSFY